MEIETIQNKIYEIRGRKVMVDFDLAAMYGIPTKVLKQSVRRNIERFEGEDFMFEISEEEYNSLIASLRSQFVTSNGEERGGRRYMPFAFTETGVAMLSSVLRSETAIQVNRSIMRAFVAMRSYLSSMAVVTAELAELRASIELVRREGELTFEEMNDLSEATRKDIDNLYMAIAELSIKPAQPQKPRRPIGYNIRRDE